MTDKRTELKGKEKILAGLTSFLEKNKIILLVILAAIVAAIIVIAVVDSVTDKKANESAAMIEDVQKVFDEWLVLEDDDSVKAEKQQAVLEQVDEVVEEYPSSYASQRALYLKAGVFFHTEKWTEAASVFEESAEIDSDSYLAPISLMLAASSYENSEDYQSALDIYIRVSNEYKDTYADVPRAILAMGRLNEQIGNNDDAVEAYNSLLDNFPGSGWASFARTRLIQLD